MTTKNNVSLVELFSGVPMFAKIIEVMNPLGGDEVKDEISENSIYLNGIKTINIIMLKSGTIYKLQYPIGTDDARLKKGRIGF